MRLIGGNPSASAGVATPSLPPAPPPPPLAAVAAPPAAALPLSPENNVGCPLLMKNRILQDS